MKKNTREQLLAQAELLFSRKGFYGTSINDVAAEVSVSKQALLHHFPSKEKLYAAVLQKAADHLLGFVAAVRKDTQAPIEQLRTILSSMGSADEPLLRVVMLLLRELLDNRERAAEAQQWFLRPFLDELVSMVEAGQEQGNFKGVHPLAFVYQLLGATQYFLVSIPTLERLYAQEEFDAHRRQHVTLIDRWLSANWEGQSGV